MIYLPNVYRVQRIKDKYFRRIKDAYSSPSCAGLDQYAFISAGSTHVRESEKVRFLGIGLRVEVDVCATLDDGSACVQHKTH